MRIGWSDCLRSVAQFSVLAAVACGIAGCSSILPASGPSSADVRQERADYGLVELTHESLAILEQFEPKGMAQLGFYRLSGAFTDRRPPSNIKFGVGDTVSVSIFEAASGGLFIPAEASARPGNFIQLPDQIINFQGDITVPYAGTIRAAGRTTVEIQNDIIERVKNRAIDPQVVVTLANQRTSLISVLGEVNTSVRYPAAASGAGDRILDAITRAGGIKGQGFETFVMLERKGKRSVVPFANLVYEAWNNIYVQPGDRIYVYREQQKFMAFGASGQQGQFPFDAWRVSVADALGKASGIVDLQGDPGAVFLYRREPREVAEMLGVDCAAIPGQTVPVVFSIDLRQPGGYFLLTKMLMRHEDIIYVANASSIDVTKFLQFLNVVMGTAGNGVALGSSSLALRSTIRGLR